MKPIRPTEPIAAFGERIRDLRRARGLTQQAVADRLQIHRTTYTKYETGCVTPDQQGLVRLAEIFSVSVDCLLGCESRDTLANTEETAINLSAEERMLVQMFRQLSAQEQKDLAVRISAAFRKKNT